MFNITRPKKPAQLKRPQPPQTRIVKPAADLELAEKAAPLVDTTKSPPPPRFVFKPEVLDRVGVSYVTIWQWMRTGAFPASREVGGKVAWLESEIDEWMMTRPLRKYKNAEAMRAMAFIRSKP